MKRISALEALERLEKLIDDFGGPYTEDHREFNALLFSLRSGPLQDSYFREKLFDLEQQAITGFSTRKFEKVVGGVSQVKVWALGSLFTARSLVEEHWPEA
ncbi:MAG: hypothetical protein DDT34_02345 [Firmicutes bacterium]|nr:hypothetical protein [Bacillota bacterium]